MNQITREQNAAKVFGKIRWLPPRYYDPQTKKNQPKEDFCSDFRNLPASRPALSAPTPWEILGDSKQSPA